MKQPPYIKRMNKVRKFLVNTCPASRHVSRMAEVLAKGSPYPMLTDEPEHCAESLASVVGSLWQARSELIALGYEWSTDGWRKVAA